MALGFTHISTFLDDGVGKLSDRLIAGGGGGSSATPEPSGSDPGVIAAVEGVKTGATVSPEDLAKAASSGLIVRSDAQHSKTTPLGDYLLGDAA
jgi:hypothetical protein